MGSDDIATYNNIASSIGFGFSGPLVEVHALLASSQEVCACARPRACMIQEERERRWLWGQYYSREDWSHPRPVCASVCRVV